MIVPTQCVITGCALVTPLLDKYAWGDLHRQGAVMIFNATNGRTGDRPNWIDTNWSNDTCMERFEYYDRCAVLMPEMGVFERRGVFIFHGTSIPQAMFNKAARGRVGPTVLMQLFRSQS